MNHAEITHIRDQRPTYPVTPALHDFYLFTFASDSLSEIAFVETYTTMELIDDPETLQGYKNVFRWAQSDSMTPRETMTYLDGLIYDS